MIFLVFLGVFGVSAVTNLLPYKDASISRLQRLSALSIPGALETRRKTRRLQPSQNP